jgi:hypothetical protein
MVLAKASREDRSSGLKPGATNPEWTSKAATTFDEEKLARLKTAHDV